MSSNCETLKHKPEERIRTWCIDFLKEKLSLKDENFRIEYQHTDISVWLDIEKIAQKSPDLIVECKAEYNSIQRHHVNQGGDYATKLQVPLLLVTNQQESYWFRIEDDIRQLQNPPLSLNYEDYKNAPTNKISIQPKTPLQPVNGEVSNEKPFTSSNRNFRLNPHQLRVVEALRSFFIDRYTILDSSHFTSIQLGEKSFELLGVCRALEFVGDISPEESKQHSPFFRSFEANSVSI